MTGWTVLGYGAEIWGWKERERAERLEERYLRWVLGVDGRTPRYMVREELQREKLRGRAGGRAWRYEKRLEKGGGSKWARMCWEEIKKRGREGKCESEWEGERKEFFTERGCRVEEVDNREGEKDWGSRLIIADKETQRKERWERIKESRYNKWYRRVKGEGPGFEKRLGRE